MNFTSIALVVLIAVGVTDDTVAQERLKASYASIGATNAIWNIAIERGFYKKHGLDVDVVYIGSTTVTSAAILGQDVPIAISRIGRVSDAAARELLKSLGLKPIDDVALRQIGGAPERISAFSQGAVAGFINPPGSIHLVGKAVPHKVLISMARSGEAAGISMGLCGNHQELLAKRREHGKTLGHGFD